jgi:hypothetical protein
MKILNKNLTILMLFCFCVLSINMNFRNNNRSISDEIIISVSPKVPSASDKLDGEMKIEVKGGKPPYTLVVHTNTRTNSLDYKGESFDLKNLAKGFYILNISDSEGNFATQTINL